MFASQRDYRKFRKRPLKKRDKEKELELSVKICIEEQLPDDPEILVIPQLIFRKFGNFDLPIIFIEFKFYIH